MASGLNIQIRNTQIDIFKVTKPNNSIEDLSSGWKPWFAWYPVATDLPRRYIDGYKIRWLTLVWYLKIDLAWSNRTQYVYVSEMPTEGGY